MSVIAAIDPNVLLAAVAREPHAFSRLALKAITMRQNEFCIGLDGEFKIFKEYMKHLKLLASSELTNAFIKTFLDRRSHPRTALLDTILDPADRSVLTRTGCTHPVEPELIAVGKVAPKDSCVVVIGEEFKGDGICPRGTNEQMNIDSLHREYPALEVWKVSEIDTKIAFLPRSRYPGSEAHLNEFLRATEDEYQEWKQPCKKVNGRDVYSERITWSIVDRALETVCAMLNCNGGEVVVGVTPDRQILGVDPPACTADGEPDDDRLSRDFSDRFCWFDPPPNQYVKPAVVPLGNGRRVVVLHVFGESTNRRYSFDNGKEIVEYDRCGPSNRRTKILGPTKRPRRFRP